MISVFRISSLRQVSVSSSTTFFRGDLRNSQCGTSLGRGSIFTVIYHDSNTRTKNYGKLVQQQRWISGNVSERNDIQKATTGSDRTEETAIMLYERNSEANTVPRAGLAMAYLSSFYWTWYAVDFIPHVNSSPIETLHIDPWVGIAGCTVAYAINFAACAYCKQMVSKVVLQKDAPNPVHVHRHSLPFMTVSGRPLEYEFGAALLDYNDNEVQKLLKSIETPGKHSLRGHLPLKTDDRRWPLGLYINEISDIKNKDLFLDTLLFASLNQDAENDQRVRKNTNASTNKMARRSKKKKKSLAKKTV